MTCCQTQYSIHQELMLKAELECVAPYFGREQESLARIICKMVKQLQVGKVDHGIRGFGGVNKGLSWHRGN